MVQNGSLVISCKLSLQIILMCVSGFVVCPSNIHDKLLFSISLCAVSDCSVNRQQVLIQSRNIGWQVFLNAFCATDTFFLIGYGILFCFCSFFNDLCYSIKIKLPGTGTN